MIRCSHTEETVDEEELRRALRPPMTPRTENEEQYEAQINQQRIFEQIHEKLVYDTIECQLSNLIDIQKRRRK